MLGSHRLGAIIEVWCLATKLLDGFACRVCLVRCTCKTKAGSLSDYIKNMEYTSDRVNWVIDSESEYFLLNISVVPVTLLPPCNNNKMLSYRRDRAAGCVIVFAISRTLELGDNDLRTL